MRAQADFDKKIRYQHAGNEADGGATHTLVAMAACLGPTTLAQISAHCHAQQSTWASLGSHNLRGWEGRKIPDACLATGRITVWLGPSNPPTQSAACLPVLWADA